MFYITVYAVLVACGLVLLLTLPQRPEKGESTWE